MWFKSESKRKQQDQYLDQLIAAVEQREQERHERGYTGRTPIENTVSCLSCGCLVGDMDLHDKTCMARREVQVIAADRTKAFEEMLHLSD